MIKPNLVSTVNPLAATHAETVHGILDFLGPRFKGPVVIAESSAGDTLEGYEHFGFGSLARDHREREVRLVDLNREGRYETLQILDNDLHLQPVRLAARLVDPDAYVICAAALKTHNAVVATLSVKNMTLGAPLRSAPQEGARWNDKRRYHVGLRQMHYNMLLTAQRLGPTWGAAVIDGFEGMEGNGPASGRPVASRLAIASTDYVAADRVGVECMGIDPAWVGYLGYCGAMRPGAVRPRADRGAGREARRRRAPLPAPPGHRAHARLDGPDEGAAFEPRLASPISARPRPPTRSRARARRPRATASTGVPGRMPWPRLKTWPGRPPARRSTSSTPREQPLARREEQRRVEVALQRDAVAEPLARLVERRPPVDADHAAAGLALRGQQVAGAGAEVDHGHVEVREGVEDAPHVRQHELAVVRLVERADPRVEELQRLGARLDLRPQVVGDDVREQAGQSVPGSRGRRT